MGITSIEWTDRTWSPIRARVKADAREIAESKGYSSLVQIAGKMAGRVGQHCEHVSPGCEHCYAETNNHRCLPTNGTGLPYDRRARDLIDSFVDDNILEQPLHWKRPQRIFVENQSDLFGEWVSDEAIDRVFAVMALCPQHTFQILTKRPERMCQYINRFCNEPMTRLAIDLAERAGEIEGGLSRVKTSEEADKAAKEFAMRLDPDNGGWPLRNVWLGVSCEDQKTADERIPLLLQTPAAIRFVSYEPAIGPVSFRWAKWHDYKNTPTSDDGRQHMNHLDGMRGINWVIVGGESGPGARPFDIAWARNTIKQCKAAGLACFVKQLGVNPYDSDCPTCHGKGTYVANTDMGPGGFPCDCGGCGTELKLKDRKGGDWLEWSEDLRVREFPEVRNAARI